MPDLNSLHTLVASARATVAAQAELKGAKKALTEAPSEAARQVAQAQVEHMLNLADWRTEALVLIHDEWECVCGTTGCAPQGLFLYQTHARSRFSTRLIRPSGDAEAHHRLPQRVKYQTRQVTLCPNCAPVVGFHTHLETREEQESKTFALRAPGQYVKEWEDARRQSAPEPLDPDESPEDPDSDDDLNSQELS